MQQGSSGLGAMPLANEPGRKASSYKMAAKAAPNMGPNQKTCVTTFELYQETDCRCEATAAKLEIADSAPHLSTIHGHMVGAGKWACARPDTKHGGPKSSTAGKRSGWRASAQGTDAPRKEGGEEGKVGGGGGGAHPMSLITVGNNGGPQGSRSCKKITLSVRPVLAKAAAEPQQHQQQQPPTQGRAGA